MTDPRCGTELGYQDHLREGSPKCTPCRQAHSATRADYPRRRYLNHAPLSVDATGTRRRIQALAAIGWSMGEQSRRLGWHESMAHSLTKRRWVIPGTAAKVAALYDELSMTPGTNLRARNEAARKGWAVPLAWDDDEIDDPAARPMHNVHGHVIGKPRDLDREQRVLELTRGGLSAAEIAMRLRTNKRYVQRVRSRYRSEGDVA
jgi:hypothetical protein